ncbi:MAG TPA: hypothetical protein ENK06_08545, partial [Gammaproteobacteria bacterium]|nr:hypothetical protein [Gammaproteobacteria bacterium]
QDEYFATGRLSGLTTHPWRDIPGVQNLDAQFKVSPHAASIAIPRQNVQLDYPQKFLAAHALTDLKSSIFANFKQSALQLAVKDMAFKLRGAQVYGSFNYDDQAVQGKQLDLALYFDNAQIDDVEYFVPAKMLPRETVDWLTQALRGGRAQHGGLLFFGELKHFPFQAADGLFDVRFDVAHGELQFASDWPEIQSIQGAFELDSNKLTFAGKSGKTMGAELSKVKIALPDFHTADKHLTIVGEVRGKTQNKLLYLLSTPLAESLSASLAPLHLDGESELSLDLNIPLLLPKETQFFGELSVKENRALAKEWKLDIEKFSTHLRFNNDGVWSDDLQGKLRQTAFQGRVETQDAPSSGRQVVLRTFSEVSDKEVLDLLGYFINKPNWGEYFSGNTEVETDIVFPLGSEDKPLQLVLSSDMRGMAVDLPYPLRKPKAEGKHLILSADLTGEQRYLNISYGDTDAIFESFASKDALQMLRGGIGFKEKAVLPDEIGYRFSGKLKEFAWAEWGPLLIPEAGKKGLLGEGGSSGSIYFDVNVEKFALFGNKFAETSIQASHTSNLWSMHLSGKELEGNIIVPVVMSSAPMVVNMSRLYVSPEAEQGNRVDIDPREMPEIKLKVADFRYKDIPFGALEVNAKKTSDGLHLDRLDIKTKKTTVSAQGDWLVTAQGQESRFNVAIESKDLGRAIKNWGYAGAISGGEGEIKLDVNWPGQPLDFDFKVANGDVDIAIKNASMLGFDLGAAKMFGLFLPRRLLLDFRDVFKKGMYFDEIKGRYTIQTGEAFTTGLFLKGPVADIHMAGRLGLSKRDYDLVVTVNRRIIGDSVPVLAALAVTPLLAAQVFIIKKMFEQQIEDILSIQYTIEGSWDDPVITPVIKNPETGEDVLDDIFEE